MSGFDASYDSDSPSMSLNWLYCFSEEVAVAVAEERERFSTEIQNLRRLTGRLEADKKKYKHLFQQAKVEKHCLQLHFSFE